MNTHDRWCSWPMLPLPVCSIRMCWWRLSVVRYRLLLRSLFLPRRHCSLIAWNGSIPSESRRMGVWLMIRLETQMSHKDTFVVCLSWWTSSVSLFFNIRCYWFDRVAHYYLCSMSCLRDPETLPSTATSPNVEFIYSQAYISSTGTILSNRNRHLEEVCPDGT